MLPELPVPNPLAISSAIAHLETIFAAPEDNALGKEAIQNVLQHERCTGIPAKSITCNRPIIGGIYIGKELVFGCQNCISRLWVSVLNSGAFTPANRGESIYFGDGGLCDAPVKLNGNVFITIGQASCHTCGGLILATAHRYLVDPINPGQYLAQCHNCNHKISMPYDGTAIIAAPLNNFLAYVIAENNRASNK